MDHAEVDDIMHERAGLMSHHSCEGIGDAIEELDCQRVGSSLLLTSLSHPFDT